MMVFESNPTLTIFLKLLPYARIRYHKRTSRPNAPIHGEGLTHRQANVHGGGLPAVPVFTPLSLSLSVNFGASLCEPAAGLGGTLSTAAGVEAPLGIEGFLGPPNLIIKGAWA